MTSRTADDGEAGARVSVDTLAAVLGDDLEPDDQPADGLEA